MRAECQCGRLSVDLPRSAAATAACHCIYCQRRTGSPFGVCAYYPADQITINGKAKRFERPTANGGLVEWFFCPECGSSVCGTMSNQPTIAVVPVGAIADPDFQAPQISAWEQSMHRWVTMPSNIQHWSQGEAP